MAKHDAPTLGALRRLVALDSGSAARNYQLGSNLLQSGRAREACHYLQAAARLDPGSSIVHVSLGQARLALGEMEDAELHLRTGIALDPNSYAGHSALARLQQRAGRFEEAAASFRQASSLAPEKAAPYFGIAYSKQIKESDRAFVRRMQDLLEGLESSSKDRSLLSYALGKAFDDLGEYESAFRHFKEANRIELLARASRGFVFNRTQFVEIFDSIKRRYDTSLFEGNAGAGEASSVPVFVVGMIRSGTTLVEQILAKHPQIAGAGELLFWRDRGRPFMKATPNAAERERLAKEYLACLGLVSREARYVVDKMPLNFAALGLIHLVFPEAKIIRCRRNPADTCLSIYVTPYRDGPEFAHDPTNICFAYEQYRQLMAHWEAVLPKGLMLNVDYEELVSNRESASRRMTEHLGLPWDEACLAHNQILGPVHTPSLWQVRQPIYRSSVGRWQNYREWLPELENS